LEQRSIFLDGGYCVSLAERLRGALVGGMAKTVPMIERDAPIRDDANPPTAAAVLVAITDRPEPGVILTQRPQSMRKHGGQVAFPGGRMDPEDENLIAAALREAEEEVALLRSDVEIIGLTDPYHTITGYVVTPVLGVIPPDLLFTANEHEVEAIFEVPLAFLLDPNNHRTQTLDWEGQERFYYEMNWEDRRIWGATAAMIVNLSRRLTWPI
jgi:8-oxo-dGTP pyrophosphatase MutT (NUDIX family)